MWGILVGLTAIGLAAGETPGPGQSAPGAQAPLRAGDRVVLLGNAFFERDHDHGLLETALTAADPTLGLQVRNLGWTGDTVWGDSRAAFETAREGFERRASLVKQLQPTVILVAYGMNESFAGQAGLERFRQGLDALLQSVEPTHARVFLISPILHENLGPPLPDPNAHNKDLVAYRDTLASLARERGLGFIDLMDAGIGNGTTQNGAPGRDTLDGIHLNESGYNRAARVLAQQLIGGPAATAAAAWSLDIQAGEAGPKVETATGARVLELSPSSPPQPVRLSVLSDRLPSTAPDRLARSLRVRGLRPGSYQLQIDGKPVLRLSAAGWAGGVQFAAGPELDQLEALQAAIVAKNRLLFYRWRPQNETYIYGFRKHEQGRNAAEIPRFDPLIAAAEAEINRLKNPVPHTYELIQVEESEQ